MTITSSLFVFSPLEQFEIVPFMVWGWEDQVSGEGIVLNFTNSDIVWGVASVELIVFSWFVLNSSIIFPHFTLKIVLDGLQGAAQLLRSTVDRKAQLHLVVLVTLFTFIAILNILGLIPWGFCVTAHLIVTQFLGGFVVLGLTLHGLRNLGFMWLNLFIPRNVPFVMLPFLSIIEFISYISRIISLSVRLFANMVAGHALLHILLGALLSLVKLNVGVFFVFFILVLPTVLIFAIFILEFGIAFLQAYVFSVLFLIYLTDSCRSH